MQEITTNSFEETRQLGENFARKLNGQDIIVLYGDLGAGKTTFAQGFAKGLGVEKRIISPTFVIIRSYKLKSAKKNLEPETFYHVDLYRLRGEEDIEETGLLEILKQKNAIVAVEWPEKMGKLLPEKRWEVVFQHLNGNERKIIIKKIK